MIPFWIMLINFHLIHFQPNRGHTATSTRWTRVVRATSRPRWRAATSTSRRIIIATRLATTRTMTTTTTPSRRRTRCCVRRRCQSWHTLTPTTFCSPTKRASLWTFDLTSSLLDSVALMSLALNRNLLPWLILSKFWVNVIKNAA